MKRFGRFVALIAAFLVSGCEERLHDVSSRPEFARMLGRSFLVSEEVKMYAVYGYSDPSTVKYVVLEPPPGFAGPEVAEVMPIAAGTKITIKKVYRSNRLSFDDLNYEVVLEGSNAKFNVPIHVESGLGNTVSNGIDLNPRYYTPLKSPF